MGTQWQFYPRIRESTDIRPAGHEYGGLIVSMDFMGRISDNSWSGHGQSFWSVDIRWISNWHVGPVTSVASECVFSASGRLISAHRSRLAEKIAEALMCMQSWSRAVMLGEIHGDLLGVQNVNKKKWYCPKNSYLLALIIYFFDAFSIVKLWCSFQLEDSNESIVTEEWMNKAIMIQDSTQPFYYLLLYSLNALDVVLEYCNKKHCL